MASRRTMIWMHIILHSLHSKKMIKSRHWTTHIITRYSMITDSEY